MRWFMTDAQKKRELEAAMKWGFSVGLMKVLADKKLLMPEDMNIVLKFVTDEAKSCLENMPHNHEITAEDVAVAVVSFGVVLRKAISWF